MDFLVAVKKTVELRLSTEPSPPQRTAPLVDFTKAVGDFGIIAEYKRASPRGVVRLDLPPWAYFAELHSYASAFSVLTEPFWFLGDYRFIPIAKAFKPVLMKDFVIDRRQIEAAYGYGADAVLIIYRLVEREKAMELAEYAQRLGLTPLVEVDNAQDAREVATWGGRVVIGINARDLRTLETNLTRAFDIAKSLRGDVDYIIESGISRPEEVEKACLLYARGVLVGTSLMKNPALAKELKAAAERCLARR
ncbi:indole-3-glycerol-phosphate synthase [Pyrobaculum neutrophilum]|uniref:Indole-3-glycerol phosphate synthase n=1 Tax=Pyrobaculum neutrophilum (strain DSM 2338 / JCM 9278 / NBRC 100436 / V24Sta) TaxID=444157 RepID=TRPC_PYRNV|nr:indole-3-glycerol-phosphate synthase [Pyrobaculum neutrophilum]B1YBK5.1 RecName: Full=Indole-3-glycerol phosphate synthase; Short=IGPS [Pyrobaculum neutrophilum V24Sta]ACB40807.1 Indole-3-glycerol-phosphate synthase [Pyrobaculum neutrophilum V24Sta]